MKRFLACGAVGFAALALLTAASVSPLNTISCSAGQFLSALATTGTFTCTAAPAGSIATASDVTLTSLANNDVFVYDNSATKWKNKTPTVVTSLLNNFVGDSGSGGTKGLVPAPASGDAAASKLLGADGTWKTPSSASLDAVSSTRGAMLYRGSGGWAGISPGTSGNILQTNGAGADPTWVAPPSGGSSSLSGDSDVTITSPADKDFLAYSSGSSKWTNRTHTAATALLDAVVGDSGSGGTKGLVPAPSSGDAAAGKVLGAGGSFGVGDPCDAFIRANPPNALSFWTQKNISSPATAADSAAGPVITTQAGSGPSARILWHGLPAAPTGFSETMVFAVDWVGGVQSSPVGILLADSTGPTLHGFGVRFNSGFPEMGDYYYSSFTPASVSGGDRAPAWPNFHRLALKLERVGISDTTNFYHSADCVNWQQFGESFYSTYPADHVGFFIDMGAGSGATGGGPTMISSITLLARKASVGP